MVDGNLFCGPCYWYLEMSPKYTLLSRYSTFEKAKLARYAEKHNITLEEALDYQSHCHCCGKFIKNVIFDEIDTRYCGERCWYMCEYDRYPCLKKGDCKVCENWHEFMVDDDDN
jgi:hypothetical protein